MTRHLATFNCTILFQAFEPGLIGFSRLRGVALLRETHSLDNQKKIFNYQNCVGLARTLSLKKISDPPLAVRYIGWTQLQLNSVSTPSKIHFDDQKK
jgi:hypothetical protein